MEKELDEMGQAEVHHQAAAHACLIIGATPRYKHVPYLGRSGAVYLSLGVIIVSTTIKHFQV